jgi:hypothetical protein
MDEARTWLYARNQTSALTQRQPTRALAMKQPPRPHPTSPLYKTEQILKIQGRQALLPMALRHDPLMTSGPPPRTCSRPRSGIVIIEGLRYQVAVLVAVVKVARPPLGVPLLHLHHPHHRRHHRRLLHLRLDNHRIMGTHQLLGDSNTDHHVPCLGQWIHALQWH